MNLSLPLARSGGGGIAVERGALAGPAVAAPAGERRLPAVAQARTMWAMALVVFVVSLGWRLPGWWRRSPVLETTAEATQVAAAPAVQVLRRQVQDAEAALATNRVEIDEWLALQEREWTRAGWSFRASPPQPLHAAGLLTNYPVYAVQFQVGAPRPAEATLFETLIGWMEQVSARPGASLQEVHLHGSRDGLTAAEIELRFLGRQPHAPTLPE